MYVERIYTDQEILYGSVVNGCQEYFYERYYTCQGSDLLAEKVAYSTENQVEFQNPTTRSPIRALWVKISLLIPSSIVPLP